MKSSIVVLSSVLALEATAHAEKIGIVVTGEATLQPQLASQLERWLHDRGRTLVPGALEPTAINTLVDCFVLEDLNCARSVVEGSASSRSLIFARIEQGTTDSGRDISVTAYYFQKGADPIAERRVCEDCTDAKLIDSVDNLMYALVHEPPPGDMMVVPPEPPQPAVATESETPAPRRSLLPYGLMGAGGAALIAGGIMIAIDEDPDPSDTTSKTYRDTGTAGAVLGIAGAAALGTGLYLYLTGHRSSAPVAAVSHDGAVVGWTGSF
jgi:hypothetical protein